MANEANLYDIILCMSIVLDGRILEKSLPVLYFAARICRVIKVLNSENVLGCKVAESLQENFFSTEMSDYRHSVPTSFLV